VLPAARVSCGSWNSGGGGRSAWGLAWRVGRVSAGGAHAAMAECRMRCVYPAYESTTASVATRGHFEQVVTELGLDRTLDFVERGREHDFVELAHHLATAEAAQFAAAAAGRALGVLHRQGEEVFTVGDALFQFEALGFGVDEDVTGGSLGHFGKPLWGGCAGHAGVGIRIRS